MSACADGTQQQQDVENQAENQAKHDQKSR